MAVKKFVMNTLKCAVNHVQELVKVLESMLSFVARILAFCYLNSSAFMCDVFLHKDDVLNHLKFFSK